MLIYITEDDMNIRQLEAYALSSGGYTVREFETASGMFEALETQVPDLIILDIMLPGTDGLDALLRIRRNTLTKDVPVIMVTAKTQEIDRVRGLDMGADDYITKPFGIMEFLSRVRALLRRTGSKEAKEPMIVHGDIAMDMQSRSVISAGENISLTYKEFELLKCLMRNCGSVLSRDQLLNNVWGADYYGETRTVDMHIKTLRQKLGVPGAQIVTVRNVGYKLVE
ncbi:MAG: response regulator transcription factor [Clostridiales bacterium]|nr:response regulator transcription factor [Clostridiales bacterium]MBQ2817847.1 response regulator transcription factor [Clostridia bacterium]